jgi:hypothetical protein
MNFRFFFGRETHVGRNCCSFSNSIICFYGIWCIILLAINYVFPSIFLNDCTLTNFGVKLFENLPKSQVENWDKNFRKVKLKIGTKITKKSS